MLTNWHNENKNPHNSEGLKSSKSFTQVLTRETGGTGFNDANADATPPSS